MHVFVSNTYSTIIVGVCIALINTEYKLISSIILYTNKLKYTPYQIIMYL